ncbi:MAG: hypothetical protein JJLCMIEE_02358 [Acidimicrobiales bacterium]|nr:hypothetical protein [Acidimicrobiales bacterium]
MAALQKEQLPQPVYPTHHRHVAPRSLHPPTTTAVPHHRLHHQQTALSPAAPARRFRGRQMLSASVIAVVVAAISVSVLVLRGVGTDEPPPPPPPPPTTEPSDEVVEAAYGLLGDFGTDAEWQCLVDSLSTEDEIVQAIEAGTSDFDTAHAGSLMTGCVSAASLAEGYASSLTDLTQAQVDCIESELASLDTATWSELLSLNLQYPASESELIALQDELFGYCLY